MSGLFCVMTPPNNERVDRKKWVLENQKMVLFLCQYDPISQAGASDE